MVQSFESSIERVQKLINRFFPFYEFFNKMTSSRALVRSAGSPNPLHIQGLEKTNLFNFIRDTTQKMYVKYRAQTVCEKVALEEASSKRFSRRSVFIFPDPLPWNLCDKYLEPKGEHFQLLRAPWTLRSRIGTHFTEGWKAGSTFCCHWDLKQ